VPWPWSLSAMMARPGRRPVRRCCGRWLRACRSRKPAGSS